MVLLHLELFFDQAELFDFLRVLLLQLADVLQRLGVLRGAEDLVELLLERRRLAQRPVRVLLVHKHHVLQNRLRDAHHVRDGRVDVRALPRNRNALARLLVRRDVHLAEGALSQLVAALPQAERSARVGHGGEVPRALGDVRPVHPGQHHRPPRWQLRGQDLGRVR